MIDRDSQIIEIKDEKIRRHYDEKSRQLYYSITDVIGTLNETSDPRNYWKVLKNRLKKAQNKLVTECNQVKMLSRDGKFYLTDVADRHTMIEIIKLISPSSVEEFEVWFDTARNLPENRLNTTVKLSTAENEDSEENTAELLVDMQETDTQIVVQAFLAGIDPENIFVSVGYEMITISGEREALKDTGEKNYLLQEIFWGKFSRTIKLSALIDIEKVKAEIKHGVLSIKLEKINRLRVRDIKVKSIS